MPGFSARNYGSDILLQVPDLSSHSSNLVTRNKPTATLMHSIFLTPFQTSSRLIQLAIQLKMLCLCQAIRLLFSKRSRRHLPNNIYELDAFDNEVKPGKYSFLVSEGSDDEPTQATNNNTTENEQTTTSTAPTQPICHISATITPRMLNSFIKQGGRCTHLKEVELDVEGGEKAGTWPVSREMSRKVQAILKHADKIGEEVEVADVSGVEEREHGPAKSIKDDFLADLPVAEEKEKEKIKSAEENDAGFTVQYQYYRPRLPTIQEGETDSDAESTRTRSYDSTTNYTPTNNDSLNFPKSKQITTSKPDRLYTLPNTTITFTNPSTSNLNTQESAQSTPTLGSFAAESPEDKAIRVKERLDRARELLAQIRRGEYKGKYSGTGYVLKETPPGEDDGDCDVGRSAGEVVGAGSDGESVSSSVLDEVNAGSGEDEGDEGASEKCEGSMC
ncbi:hypothetical protein FB567DRAFT_549929 [Paraphoma chrysanthemicola]|uniref:Uncharacterized protein n=1 Tax=Paraphoma chrysanthemicola TaxID=798071 RepID=A0A8K0VXJ0_9PLEO|nr:hypothetical protein FB567DRAFT_549929 [Paraphoma chrysanthemicola]